MNKLSQFVKNHKLEIISFLLIFLLASFLRLYKIRDFVVFLGDEGRDALVVKRMLVDHKFTLLGPTASVGGFYLGPVYYYFMLPFMFLSGLDPAGPAVMIALMGLTTLVLLYFVIRDWFGTLSAQLTTLLYAVSPGIVTFSRSSWNPNPMPLFSLIALSSLHYAITKNKLILALIAGIAYGIAIQLHYLGLIIGPILAVMTFVLAKRTRWIKLSLTQIIGFFIGASMYFTFEIRHGFPNIIHVIEFVTRGGATTGPRSLNPLYLFYEINRFNFESIISRNLGSITPYLTYSFFTLVAIYLYFQFKQRIKPTKTFLTVFIFWLVGIFGIGMYKGQLHYHYFQYLFPAPFLLFALMLSSVRATWLKVTAASLVIIASIILIRLLPIWVQGSKLIDQTHNIANQVIRLSGGDPFNFALITPGNSDHAYRFFLEVDDAKPTPLDEQVTTQLIVVCEEKPDNCHPLGNPLWEIAGFGRAEIVEQMIVFPEITLFRLIHHSDSIDSIGKPANQG